MAFTVAAGLDINFGRWLESEPDFPALASVIPVFAAHLVLNFTLFAS
jgi:hypothetical protein